MSRSALLMSAVALLVSGCGGGDDQPSAATAPAQTAPTSTGSGGGPPPGKGNGGGGNPAAEDPAGQPAADREPRAKRFDPTMRGVAYPAVITRGAREAVLAVEDTLGPETNPGQQTVVAADCREGVCVIRYRSVARGKGNVTQGQEDILGKLFARPAVERVVLLVHHQSNRTTKEERPAFMSTDCTRSDAPDFDWTQITTADIAERCEFRTFAGGKLRNLVRRGREGLAEASMAGVDPATLPGQ